MLKLAKLLLSQPTAPYHEDAVRAVVEEHCRGLGLKVERDSSGNVLVKPDGPRSKRPLVFMAHMDHPGFEMVGKNRAEFLGGVPKEYFKGAAVKFITPTGIARATVQRVLPGWPKKMMVALKFSPRAANPEPSTFGMWDLPEVRVRGDRLAATTIDDVLGVAAMLAMLSELARRRSRADVWAVFTRAEEVGFHGAIALARSGRIPRGAVVVSVEMSRERPWARIGGGPVLRVGDRLSVFDAGAVYFLQEAARRSTISVQRCLMDGGTCEATALGAYGYRTAGLCLALGNYHNIGKRGRVEAEYVSSKDFVWLVKLMVAAATEWKKYDTISKGLRRRMEQIASDAPRAL